MSTITFSTPTANSDRERENDFSVSNAHLPMHKSGIHSTFQRLARLPEEGRFGEVRGPLCSLPSTVLRSSQHRACSATTNCGPSSKNTSVRTCIGCTHYVWCNTTWMCHQGGICGRSRRSLHDRLRAHQKCQHQGLFLFKYLMFLSSSSPSSPPMKFTCVRLSSLCTGIWVCDHWAP